MKLTVIKTLGDWELEVLAAPFGDETNKDSDGEFFTPNTKFYFDKVNPVPVYYHGYDESGYAMDNPEVLGDTKSVDVRPDGVWLRILLDKTSEYAKRVWESAKQGLARASSGSAPHLVRKTDTGQILHWPMFEISLFDTNENRQPANRYAIALPVMKMRYNEVELESLEAEEKGEKHSSDASDQSDTKSKNRSIEMSDENKKELSLEDIGKVVSESAAKSAADTVKAIMDADKADKEAVAKRQTELEDAKKAGVEEGKKVREDEIKAQLRLDNFEPITVLKYADAKFDNLDAGEQALLVGVLEANGKKVSEVALKSLAAKLEEDKSIVGEKSRQAMKARGIKANEMDYSTYGTFGDEWVGVGYSTSLWEKIRMGTFVMQKLAPYSIEVPQGQESIVIPLESTDPVFYKVAQATALDGTMKVPVPTVTNSPIQTGNQTLTLSKLGGRMLFSGEMEEDSLIPWVPQIMFQLQQSGINYLESAILDGDTTTATTANINNIAATPSATDWFLMFDGFRKIGLVTNTANSRSAAAGLGVEDFLETAKLLGTNGRNAIDKTKVSFIIDPAVMWKSLTLPEVGSRDIFSAATIESGTLTGLWGYKIDVCGNMCFASTVQKSNAAGKVDVSVVGNNLYGSILAVRWDQWRLGWKRRMKLETTRIANADTTEIVATMRVGMTYRDTEAAGITYYVGV